MVGHRAELGRVHGGVLVLAEVLLQGLEPLHQLGAGPRVEEGAEALQQVAQLLGVLAEVVEPLVGRLGGDGAALVEQRRLGPSDPLGHVGTERVEGPVGQDLGQGAGEPAAPGGEALEGLLGLQPRGEGGVGLVLGPDQVGPHGFEVDGRVRTERLGVGRPAEEIDVEVAGWPGEVAQQREPEAGLAPHVVGDHPATGGQHRPGSAGGHPEVVEELGVEPFDGALPVAGDDVGQVCQHGPEALDGGEIRPELRLRQPGCGSRAGHDGQGTGVAPGPDPPILGW